MVDIFIPIKHARLVSRLTARELAIIPQVKFKMFELSSLSKIIKGVENMKRM